MESVQTTKSVLTQFWLAKERRPSYFKFISLVSQPITFTPSSFSMSRLLSLSLCFSKPLYVFLFLALSPCVCLSPPSLSPHVSHFLSHSLHVSLCLYLDVRLSLSMFLPICLSPCLSLSHYVSLSIFMSFSFLPPSLHQTVLCG